MHRHLRIDLTARLENLAFLGVAIRAMACEELGSEEYAAAMELAAIEACSNVIRHGHPGAPDHVFRVEVTGEAGVLTVTIEDEGPGFAFTDAPMPEVDGPVEDLPTGGFGLPLIHATMDAVEFERADGINRLRLIKRGGVRRPVMDLSGG